MHGGADGISAGELLQGRRTSARAAAIAATGQAASKDFRLVSRLHLSPARKIAMNMSPGLMDTLPVAVIGAGPVGLSAAAQLAHRRQNFVVFESGEGPGAAVREWSHVTFFSPWRYTVDEVARQLLEPTGWSMPDPDRDPTGGELVNRYLVPLAAHPAIAPNLRYNARVI